MAGVTVTVECLSCGCLRGVQDDGHILSTGDCPRCGYVGWAHAAELSEDDRRGLREIPVPLRPFESRAAGAPWR